MDSKEILLYWFGNENKFNSKKWFIESYKYDNEIKEKFEKMLLVYEMKKDYHSFFLLKSDLKSGKFHQIEYFDSQY